MVEERSDGARCSPNKDFMRHIVNHVMAQVSEKLPFNVFNEIKNRLSRAEDKFRFSIYGGQPMRLIDYLSSDDWAELVQYASNINVEWVLVEMLKLLEEYYKDTCPPVAQKARKAFEEIEKAKEKKEEGKPHITAETVARILKLRGYKVEVQDDRVVLIEGSTFRGRVEIVDGLLRYSICREGIAHTIDGFEAKLRRIRET